MIVANDTLSSSSCVRSLCYFFFCFSFRALYFALCYSKFRYLHVFFHRRATAAAIYFAFFFAQPLPLFISFLFQIPLLMVTQFLISMSKIFFFFCVIDLSKIEQLHFRDAQHTQCLCALICSLSIAFFIHAISLDFDEFCSGVQFKSDKIIISI